MNIDWHRIITDKNYSEEVALDILTSPLYSMDNMLQALFLAGQPTVPSLYNKHMLKNYFSFGPLVERPDLQSKKLDLGVEVTRPIDEKEIVSLKVIEEIGGKATSADVLKSNLKEIDKKGKFAGTIQNVNNGYLINFKTDNIKEIVKNSIKGKVELAPSYSSFGEYWLFMFCFAYISEDDLLAIIKDTPGAEWYSTYILLSAANSGEIWFARKPYNIIEKRTLFL